MITADLDAEKVNFLVGALYAKLSETNTYLANHPGRTEHHVDPDCCQRCSREHLRQADYREQHDSLVERRTAVERLIVLLETSAGR